MLDLKFRPPLSRGHLEDRTDLTLNYYATLRPHQGLDGATPARALLPPHAAHATGGLSPRATSRDPAPIAALPIVVAHLDAERRTLPHPQKTRRVTPLRSLPPRSAHLSRWRSASSVGWRARRTVDQISETPPAKGSKPITGRKAAENRTRNSIGALHVSRELQVTTLLHHKVANARPQKVTKRGCSLLHHPAA
jgi:hypothetical protein